MKTRTLSLSGLTRQSLFAALIVIPLLFTSCLADALNKKFGYQVPVYVYYSSEQSSAPDKRKIPTGQPLADEDLPSLEAQGWIFGGWYSDKEYTSKMESGIVLESSTTLYALWIPRDDTPFVIQNFFMDIRTGSTEFVFKPDYTQYLTGTTASYVVPSQYNLINDYPGDSDLRNFSMVSFYDRNLTYDDYCINGDGSTVIKNYYFRNHLYTDELDTVIRALPEDSQTYDICCIQRTAGEAIDFDAIRTAISLNRKILDYYEDYETGEEKAYYNRSFFLSFFETDITAIEPSALSYTTSLLGVTLPSTCTKIGNAAFNGCSDLRWVSTNTWDESKSWHLSVDGSDMSFGCHPNEENFAYYLRKTWNTAEYY